MRHHSASIILPFAIFLVLKTASKSYRVSQFQEEYFLTDVYPENLSIALSPSRSAVDCARQCQTVQWCNNFAFNGVAMNCSRQKLSFMTSRETNFTYQRGWRHFKLLQDSECPTYLTYVADRSTKTCYRFSNQTMAWNAARNDCKINGEDLAVLEPVDKAVFVLGHLDANKDSYRKYDYSDEVFIGAIRDSNGTFLWVNGMRVNMSATAALWVAPPSEAGKEVISLNAKLGYRFKEAWMSSDKYYVCERPFLSSQ